MKSAIYFGIVALIFHLFIETASQGGNLQQLSYGGGDAMQPYRPPTTSTTTTMEPPTTKSSGFFGGIKNWFRKDSTTEASTTTTTTTTTPRPYPANIPKPSSVTQTTSNLPVSSTVATGGRRDYVNPNTPGSPSSSQFPSLVPSSPSRPVSPQATPHALPSSWLPTPSSPTTGGRRDYVNPSVSTPKTPTIKEEFPALPSPRGQPQQAGQSTTSTTVQSVWGSRPGSPQPGSSSGSNRQSPWSSPPSSPGTGNGGSMVSFVQPGSTSTGRPQHTRTTSTRPGQDRIGVNLATDDELTSLSETLLSKDVNNLKKYVTLSLQGKTRSYESTDEAPNALLQIDSKAYDVVTVSKMIALFNNYELDSSVNEYVTSNEKKEENEFIDAVMATSVMRQAMLFLQNKGIVTPDPQSHRDLLKTIWFALYSRGGGKIGSSGFEHIFMAEKKNGTVVGLHNALYFYEQEQKGNIDYKGYLKTLDFGNKGSIVKYRFTFNGLSKPVNAMFIGTSPELELALYTVCFQVRADNDCPISLNGHRFNMPTYAFRYRGKRLVGSGFPEI